MRTPLDEVAEALVFALTSADPALLGKLGTAMSRYAEVRSRDLHNLLRAPGFRKLWDSMNLKPIGD